MALSADNAVSTGWRYTGPRDTALLTTPGIRTRCLCSPSHISLYTSPNRLLIYAHRLFGRYYRYIACLACSILGLFCAAGVCWDRRLRGGCVGAYEGKARRGVILGELYWLQIPAPCEAREPCASLPYYWMCFQPPFILRQSTPIRQST